MNKIKKIYHLHGDSKFIDASQKYEVEGFENHIIIFKLNREYTGFYKNNAGYFERNINDAKKVVDLCCKADMVVVWGMDDIKSYVVNRLPYNVKVIWRFFGFELYNINQNLYLSETTLDIIAKNSITSIFNNLYSNIIKNKFITFLIRKFFYQFNKEFDTAIKRVDYFSGICINEYNYLKENYSQFPEYLDNYTITPDFGIDLNLNKDKVIICGHNRSYFNNHFEILKIIEENSVNKSPRFIFPFNYGNTNLEYSETLLKKLNNNPQIEILTQFITKNDYVQLFNNASALVLNHYRQMAGGNIIIGLNLGVKIYLNPRNVLYEFYKSEGFLIFTIDDFAEDLRKQTYQLNQNEVEHNIKQWKALSLKYSHEKFIQNIKNILNQ